jgi:hypothetical protein
LTSKRELTVCHGTKQTFGSHKRAGQPANEKACKRLLGLLSINTIVLLFDEMFILSPKYKFSQVLVANLARSSTPLTWAEILFCVD